MCNLLRVEMRLSGIFLDVNVLSLTRSERTAPRLVKVHGLCARRSCAFSIKGLYAWATTFRCQWSWHGPPRTSLRTPTSVYVRLLHPLKRARHITHMAATELLQNGRHQSPKWPQARSALWIAYSKFARACRNSGERFRQVAILLRGGERAKSEFCRRLVGSTA